MSLTKSSELGIEIPKVVPKNLNPLDKVLFERFQVGGVNNAIATTLGTTIKIHKVDGEIKTNMISYGSIIGTFSLQEADAIIHNADEQAREIRAVLDQYNIAGIVRLQGFGKDNQVFLTLQVQEKHVIIGGDISENAIIEGTPGSFYNEQRDCISQKKTDASGKLSQNAKNRLLEFFGKMDTKKTDLVNDTSDPKVDTSQFDSTILNDPIFEREGLKKIKELLLLYFHVKNQNTLGDESKEGIKNFIVKDILDELYSIVIDVEESAYGKDSSGLEYLGKLHALSKIVKNQKTPTESSNK